MNDSSSESGLLWIGLIAVILIALGVVGGLFYVRRAHSAGVALPPVVKAAAVPNIEKLVLPTEDEWLATLSTGLSLDSHMSSTGTDGEEMHTRQTVRLRNYGMRDIEVEPPDRRNTWLEIDRGEGCEHLALRADDDGGASARAEMVRLRGWSLWPPTHRENASGVGTTVASGKSAEADLRFTWRGPTPRGYRLVYHSKTSEQRDLWGVGDWEYPGLAVGRPWELDDKPNDAAVVEGTKRGLALSFEKWHLIPQSDQQTWCCGVLILKNTGMEAARVERLDSENTRIYGTREFDAGRTLDSFTTLLPSTQATAVPVVLRPGEELRTVWRGDLPVGRLPQMYQAAAVYRFRFLHTEKREGPPTWTVVTSWIPK